jgi:iron complex transport system substrate-binding protein
MIKKLLIGSILITFFNCHNKKEVKQDDPKIEFKYAKHLSITENSNSFIIEANGNKTILNKTELPFTNIISENSATIAYLNELGALNSIKGVVDANYIYNEEISRKIANKTILEVGNNSELFLESILKQKPQLVIANSNPAFAKFHQQLEDNGIKILYLDEYKENDPLGRLEYLKLFGLLVNKEDLANKKVLEITKNYDSIKQIIQTQGKGKVKTLLNNMYGDIWYLPTGNLLQAKIIDDAKGNYIFKTKTGDSSLNLTFEEVYTQGKDANYWLNTNFSSLQESKAAYPNYTWFDAFKLGNIYNPDKRSNKNGAMDYYEQGIIRPDIILNDLGKIFYPDLFPNYELYFYRQLK